MQAAKNLTLEVPTHPHVLVVEDDPDLADVVRFELEICGCAVETVSSAHEACLRMQEGSLDLVISDVKLPGGSGLHVLFCDDASTHRTPVVMMSGFMSPELRKIVAERGATCLEKPFTFRALRSSVSHALRPI